MPVTATGPISLPFPSAAILLASSANYQTLVGTGSASVAYNTIHWPYTDVASSPPALPYSSLADYDQLHQDQETTTHAESGELLLQLYMLPNPSYTDPRDIITDWRNKLGAILLDMLNNARNPVGDGTTYWGMTGWKKHDTPQPVKASDCDLQLVDGNDNPIESFLFAGFILTWNT
jgi:hypothetical protein